MNARSQTLRNTLFSTVGIYTEFFLGMLTSILIARHLGPHDPAGRTAANAAPGHA